MAILLSDGGALKPTTEHQTSGGYAPVAIGKPLAIEMRAFYPGRIKRDWGNKAELMVTTQTRVGPSNEAAPRIINMLVKGYDYRAAEPIRSYGGDIYGDGMLYYTKSYTGATIRTTLRAVELNKIGGQSFDALTNTLKSLGKLAHFTEFVPYLAAAGLATRVVQALLRVLLRNDRLAVASQDLYFDSEDDHILQAGRYVMWPDGIGPSEHEMMRNFHLAGRGGTKANLLVDANNELFKVSPYFVLRIEGKKRAGYDEFEIGAGSAILLEQWADRKLGQAVFTAARDLARQVNDAKQLTAIADLIEELRDTRKKKGRAALIERIDAHHALVSKHNRDLLELLLEPIVRPV